MNRDWWPNQAKPECSPPETLPWSDPDEQGVQLRRGISKSLDLNAVTKDLHGLMGRNSQEWWPGAELWAITGRCSSAWVAHAGTYRIDERRGRPAGAGSSASRPLKQLAGQ